MRSIAGLIALAAIVVACSSSDDEVAPACNGVSPVGLATEQTQDGQCPTSPTMLTGMVPAYAACSQSTDCAPFKCTCPGSNDCAYVAQCEGSNCLDGATTCCLYSQQCQ
jgi:hypothetical protein